MSYVVLARKWRPMRFEDLIGQEHVARTLSNAIAADRVAHAFLFTGVRGVGKTTSARILAKALNCMRPPGSVPAGTDPGPTATPCLECAPCLEIATGSDVDVREIDGASYTGVDDVRKLQDTMPYRPARDRYKIFIVDEVHMLSQNAWNAFLKTLEEPPPHVKFIFATTEVQKVPVTILSRVQRFDFKLIPSQLIAARLKHVLETEGISADDQALGVIAREAAGSMRDAMSLLDQVIAWGGERLSGADVARVLGVASHQVLHDIAGALLTGDAARCLEIVGELANQGFDIAHVARDLLALLRDLVVAKVCRDPSSLLDLADSEAEDVLALSGRSEADDLLRLHQGFSQAYDEVIKSAQPRAALEMLLVRLARRPPLLPIDDLLGRLVTLERRLGGAGVRPAAAPAGRSPVSAAPAPIQAAEPVERPKAEFSAPPPPEPAPALVDPPPRPRLVAAEPRAVPSEPEPPAVVLPAMDDWRKIVDRVREERPELAAFLEHAAPLEVAPGQLVLGWERGSMFADEASSKESMALLTRAASEHFQTSTSVTFELDSARAMTAATVASLESEARKRHAHEAVSRARHHPRVADAIEILGARLKDVKLAGD